MTRLTLVLEEDEKAALFKLAQTEYREPQAQARLILRADLARRGLLVEPLRAVKPSQKKEGARP